MINTTLINRWNANNGEWFGISLHELSKTQLSWIDDNPYFFLKRELNVRPEDWKNAKARGEIRHCKIYKNKFLDYVVHREFNTLHDWARDAGGTIDDVLFGVNRMHQIHGVSENGRWVNKPMPAKYVELKVLLNALGYVEPPKVEIPAYTDVSDSDVETPQPAVYRGPEPIHQAQPPKTATEVVNHIVDLHMRMHYLTIDNVWVIADGVPRPWKSYVH